MPKALDIQGRLLGGTSGDQGEEPHSLPQFPGFTSSPNLPPNPVPAMNPVPLLFHNCAIYSIFDQVKQG